MNEMTLASRYRIRNSGGLRPSTLPLGHGGSPQYSLKLEGESGVRIRDIRLSQPMTVKFT